MRRSIARLVVIAGLCAPGVVRAQATLYQYNVSLPTCVNGKTCAGQVDVNGRLITTGSISGTVTATQGTAAAASAPWAMRLSDGTNFNSATGPVYVSPATSTVWVAVGGAADGGAVSGNPVRIGGKDGSGNTQDIATDTAGNIICVGAGTAGSGVGGVASIQGVVNGVAVPVSLASTVVQQAGYALVTAGSGVACGTAATPISFTAGTDSLTLTNADATKTINIGDSGVTTAKGLAVLPGQAASIDIAAGLALYCITTATTATLNPTEWAY